MAGLVSVHDATWTTDRALAADRWADIDPELRAALPELLAWSDGRSLPGGRHEVERMLDVAIGAHRRRLRRDDRPVALG